MPEVKMRQSTGNGLFILAAGLSALPMVNESLANPLLSMGLPVGIVAAYAILTGIVLSAGGNGPEALRHRIESVYFLGFFLTLLAMLLLFYRLSLRGLGALTDEGISAIFLAIGTSVGTTMAGVLGRNVLLGRFASRIEANGSDLQDSYRLLKEIAEGFSARYEQTFAGISEFLDERRENQQIFAHREGEFLDALGHLASVLREAASQVRDSETELAESLAALRELISAAREGAGAFAGEHGAFIESMERSRRLLEAAPFAEIGGDLTRFREETRELNQVVDSVIELLDARVEKVRL
jgi:hypothetical protein